MEVSTNLSNVIDSIDDLNAKYDDNVKAILGDKQIASMILKYTLEEFQYMSLDEIASCIEDVKINVVGEPGLTNIAKISGDNVEDCVLGEGKILFDVRFSARPGSEERYKILVNIEAQAKVKRSALGYYLENRILYYLSRMVSAQKQTEFFHSDYDNLKKVRGIWILMDPEERRDSITEISLESKCLFGNAPQFSNLDLIKGFVVRIRGKDADIESKNKLIAMLEMVLSDEAPGKKKKELEKYGIKMSVELERRIEKMCNLSELIVEEGIEKGIERGRAEERKELLSRMQASGVTREQLLAIGFTLEEIGSAESAAKHLGTAPLHSF